jgi:gluconolactonase
MVYANQLIFPSMNKVKIALTLSLIVVSPIVQAQSAIIAKGSTPVLLSSEFLFTEGPAVDAKGNVYFTDQPNDRIMKWTTDGKLSVYMEGTGRSNGLYIDKDGNLVACADLNNQLWSINKNKSVTVLIKDFEGKKLNGPNDLWIDPQGGIYFTDPFYKRDYWTRTEKEIESENVYYLSPDRKKLSLAASDLMQPNGIIGTPDGKTLYVADIKGRKTYAYTIQKDGTLTDRELFADMGSDGMTVDSEGNVYLTGKGVTVFSSKGEKLETIAIDAPWTANVCFGGKDRKTLFITASKSVFTLKMKVKGAY